MQFPYPSSWSKNQQNITEILNIGHIMLINHLDVTEFASWELEVLLNTYIV